MYNIKRNVINTFVILTIFVYCSHCINIDKDGKVNQKNVIKNKVPTPIKFKHNPELSETSEKTKAEI